MAQGHSSRLYTGQVLSLINVSAKDTIAFDRKLPLPFSILLGVFL